MAKQYDDAELKRLEGILGIGGHIPTCLALGGSRSAIAHRLAKRLEELAREAKWARQVCARLLDVPYETPAFARHLETEAASLSAWADEQGRPKVEPCDLCVEMKKYLHACGDLVVYCPACKTLLNPTSGRSS